MNDNLFPADRYRWATSRLGTFAAALPFELDDFQKDACEALEDGKSVLVAAPTGSGKTVVGLFGVYLALSRGRRVAYTTPIKALSNQKYQELVTIHGEPMVGLLTGDISINPDAPALVMTTEVLRNMIYNSAPLLDELDVVVMDEVHYLADRFRGPVWEEVIIHLPEPVQLVSLSATVSNAEEFGAWLTEVRGETEIVVSEQRPVPLWQHVLIDRTLYALYTPDGSLINPELKAITRSLEFEHRRGRRVSRASVIRTLDADGLLPAIVFIFSRAGCEAAVDQVMASGIRLTTDAEARTIRNVIEARTAAIPSADLGALGYMRWSHALESGVAAHHAGLIPLFKEVVEELFAEGLLKVIYATETLALGINMPARSVVLEKLTKWDGSSHVRLTPGEYTQLTGRAGRRGIDIEGHGVVMYGREVDVESVAGLASKRTYPLRSAFRATYNMAVNLHSYLDEDQSRDVLRSSFAQFQADRSVVGLARELRKAEARVREAERLIPDDPSLLEYSRLRTQLSQAEKEHQAAQAQARRDAAAALRTTLKRGDVLAIGSGRRAEHMIITNRVEHLRFGVIFDVVTSQAKSRRISGDDLDRGAVVLGRLRIDNRTNSRTPRGRKDLAARLHEFLNGRSKVKPAKQIQKPNTTLVRLRDELRNHPAHTRPDIEEHMGQLRRISSLTAERDRILARITGRTGSIAEGFDRVSEFLTELGYLGDGVTPDGQILRRINGERDLVLAEVLREGVWDDLAPAECAAAATLAVFESRGEEAAGNLPTPARLRRAIAATEAIGARINHGERKHGIPTTPPVEIELAAPMYAWASGAKLGAVLDASGLLPGDFVRWSRQVLDILHQVRTNPHLPESIKVKAEAARRLIDRDIVALSTL